MRCWAMLARGVSSAIAAVARDRPCSLFVFLPTNVELYTTNTWYRVGRRGLDPYFDLGFCSATD